jgi:hypothetical protein
MIGMGTPSSSLAHSGRHPVITHPFAPQWPALCRSLSEPGGALSQADTRRGGLLSTQTGSPSARVVGRVAGCQASSDRNSRATLFRNCCAVFQDDPSDAGPGTPWLVTQDPTCELISYDHEVIAGYPAYSVSHRGWHMR